MEDKMISFHCLRSVDSAFGDNIITDSNDRTQDGVNMKELLVKENYL